MFKSFPIFVALILLFTFHAVAQKKDKKEVVKYSVKPMNAEERFKAFSAFEQMKKESIFGGLNWQFIGPKNISGRMTDMAVVTPKGKNYTVFVATAGGGVWRTKNEGVKWEPVFENAASAAIGDITIAPSNPDIVWIGTGESNIFRSSNAGSGVYKSVDGGTTWVNKGLTSTYTISRIVINPTNPDIVYVAASGSEWTTNTDRGIYKTTDGGTSWKKVLYINESTGIMDLVIDPADPNTLYATSWQRIRHKWNDPRNEKDYTGSGIYKSTNAGENWVPINTGLPEARFRGRIGIDVSRSNSNVLYAFIDNYEQAPDDTTQTANEEEDSYGRPTGGRIKGATVFKSTDKGKTWVQVSEQNDYMLGLSGTYGWVFGQIRIDPNDENKIFVMGLFLNVSTDGGKTFKTLDGMHMDHHGLWVDPENTNYMVNVNDGGVAISYDNGENWRTFSDNIPVVQFFNVNYDMAKPFHVYGSIQDHGSYKGEVDLSNGRNKIPVAAFTSAPGGEGSNHAIDPSNPDIVYSAGFYGTLSRTNVKTGESQSIVPKPAKGEPKYRGQWLAPFIISPHNPQIIYHGMNYVFRSLNSGDTWEKISPDLTFNDTTTMGDIPYHTLFTISESPLKFGLIYAGTDDGRAHVTKNSGQNWEEISKGLPVKWISRLVASKYDEATVYMSQNGKRDDDFRAYLWKSIDYGKTWTDISKNIPCGPVNVIREDPANKNILYVGTDMGVYVSIDSGNTWNVLAGNFPVAYVHDLVIQPRENIMIIATHGRGMWAMDISIIQKMTPEVLASNAFVFDIGDAMVSPKYGSWGREVYTPASVVFYVKKLQKLTISVTNEKGEVVKTAEIEARTGINMYEWNLKLKDNKEDKFVQGPGKYTLKLSTSEDDVEKQFNITQQGNNYGD
jgi:photosystem II stability/assembly factor-like uncharacterized protein